MAAARRALKTEKRPQAERSGAHDDEYYEDYEKDGDEEEQEDEGEGTDTAAKDEGVDDSDDDYHNQDDDEQENVDEIEADRASAAALRVLRRIPREQRGPDSSSCSSRSLSLPASPPAS